MSHDSKDLSRWTMTSKATTAPVTASAREVDFADDALSKKMRAIGRNHFTDEFMPGRARKAVVPAKKLEIGIADSPIQEADGREAFGPSRSSRLSNRSVALLKVNRDHFG